jgi:hypothetical protein
MEAHGGREEVNIKHYYNYYTRQIVDLIVLNTAYVYGN